LVAGRKAVESTKAELANRMPHAMIAAPIELVRATNRYFDTMAPWQLQKEGKTERLNTVLNVSLEAIRVAAALLQPVMPNKMKEIRKAVGVPQPSLVAEAKEFEHLRALKAGAPVGVAEAMPNLKSEKAGESAPEAAAEDGLIDISEFGKVQLAVAEVLEAAKVDGADRLLQLKIQVGDEQRPLVAGIADYYKPEELVGRRIIVVKNLKPAKIRGIESRGMLLAAKKGKKLVLVTTDGEIPSGASVG